MKVGDLVREKFGGLWRTGIVLSTNRYMLEVLFEDGTTGGGLQNAYYLLEAA